MAIQQIHHTIAYILTISNSSTLTKLDFYFYSLLFSALVFSHPNSSSFPLKSANETEVKGIFLLFTINYTPQ